MKAATDATMSYDTAPGISIHAAREGGDAYEFDVAGTAPAISIHAAREGGDRIPGGENRLIGISIHAAREGGDRYRAIIHIATGDFNPRRP